MSFNSFEEIIQDLSGAIDLCMDHKLYQSVLVLIYSGIDTMAWLNLPKSKKEVNRTYFEEWVNEFLLPDSGLLCNATDLYGARCGLIHSHIVESRLSRKNEARRICYAYGIKGVKNLRKYLNSIGKYSDVPVKIEELKDAFFEAINRYLSYLAKYPQKCMIVVERADSFLIKKHSL